MYAGAVANCRSFLKKFSEEIQRIGRAHSNSGENCIRARNVSLKDSVVQERTSNSNADFFAVALSVAADSFAISTLKIVTMS